MNRNKLRDILISCFLISTLGLATFMVSCSEQDSIISSSFDASDNYHQHVHSQSGVVVDAVTATFEAVGEGAAGDLGSVGMGWVLGAMGLTGASGPNWNAEFQTINDDLNQIISLLSEADAELSGIDSVLQVLNCSVQQTSLQDDIGAIINEYLAYNSILTTAASGDTVLYSADSIFADHVINGIPGGQVPISTALSNIQANIESGSNVIVSCMQPIPQPALGTFGSDSLYYLSAQSLLNYYYYYQTIGLGLLSEAYHWQAWVKAGKPGADSNYSADSVQLVCNDQSAEVDCNTVINTTNNLYNTLLKEFKDVGAQYSGSDLLYQRNSIGQDLVWVRSLEDYTQQSGANCNTPLTSINTSSADPTCGPTAGIVGSTLSFTTYYGTQNFNNPGFSAVNGLVTPNSSIPTGQPIYQYLESLGFENMNNKVLIADSLIRIKNNTHNGYTFVDTMSVVPFIVNGNPEFTNAAGVVKAIYSDVNDFLYAMEPSGYSSISNSPCQDNTAPAVKVNWVGNTSAGPVQTFWLNGNGYQKICEYTQYNPPQYDAMSPFSWNSTTNAAGWSYYQINSNPQNAYFIPVRSNFSGSTGCLSGYNNLNAGGFITKCGEDFQDYLNVNLPVPPSCGIPNSTPCTALP